MNSETEDSCTAFMLFICPAAEINALIELASCDSKSAWISTAPMNQQESVIAPKWNKVRPQVTRVDENTNNSCRNLCIRWTKDSTPPSTPPCLRHCPQLITPAQTYQFSSLTLGTFCFPATLSAFSVPQARSDAAVSTLSQVHVSTPETSSPAQACI